jgi:NTE family protein
MTSPTTLTPRRDFKTCSLLAVLLCVAVAGDAWGGGQSCGQPQEVTGRPRIGLALAGGGGKGWAHIGVLKVLEEMHVPIDCIAGTSAGSIIGGVYASGLSPEEMEKIVIASDWGVIFEDRAPRQDQSFERKAQDLRGLWDLELGVGKGGVKLPSGIFAGQQVNALLRRMTTRAVGVSSFDELQIPFRAVATDLKTGEMVVLDHGELAAAMRASMAVPGAFTPETIDGRLLVDGGLRENLPVQTVRAMGADVIIAVDLGTTTVTDAQLANPLAITQQMVNILLDLNVYASRDALKSTDVLISPQVQKFASGDFGQVRELVPLGMKAARDVQDKLLVLSLPKEQYGQFRDAQRARSREGATVARVQLDESQLRHVNPEYVRKKFAVTEKSDALDEKRIQDEIGGLLGEGDYERIDYRYEDQPEGDRALVISLREKPWGPGYLRFGLQLATDFKEDTYFNVLGSYRRTWVNKLGAEWRNDFSLGQTTGLRSEFYQPVWLGQGLFVAPILAVGQTTQNLFIGNQPVASYRIQTIGGQFDVGWTFGRYAQLRVGIERAQLRYDPSVAIPAFPAADFTAAGFVGTFTIDRLDSGSLPRSGYFMNAMYRDSLPGLGADVDYQKAGVGALAAFSSGRNTLQLQLKAAGAIQGDLPIYDLVYLGGLFNLSGYLINQLQGQQSVFGRAAYYYRLADVPVLVKGLYAGVSLEVGQVFGRLDGSPAVGLLPAAAVFLGADTALGPFYLAYGHAFDASLNTVYLYLGRFY